MKSLAFILGLAFYQPAPTPQVFGVVNGKFQLLPYTATGPQGPQGPVGPAGPIGLPGFPNISGVSAASIGSGLGIQLTDGTFAPVKVIQGGVVVATAIPLPNRTYAYYANGSGTAQWAQLSQTPDGTIIMQVAPK